MKIELTKEELEEILSGLYEKQRAIINYDSQAITPKDKDRMLGDVNNLIEKLTKKMPREK